MYTAHVHVLARSYAMYSNSNSVVYAGEGYTF